MIQLHSASKRVPDFITEKSGIVFSYFHINDRNFAKHAFKRDNDHSDHLVLRLIESNVNRRARGISITRFRFFFSFFFFLTT